MSLITGHWAHSSFFFCRKKLQKQLPNVVLLNRVMLRVAFKNQHFKRKSLQWSKAIIQSIKMGILAMVKELH